MVTFRIRVFLALNDLERADFSCFYYSGSDWIQLCIQRKNSGSTNKPTCFLFIFSFSRYLFLVISFSYNGFCKKKAHIQELEEEVKLLKNHSHPNIVVSNKLKCLHGMLIDRLRLCFLSNSGHSLFMAFRGI